MQGCFVEKCLIGSVFLSPCGKTCFVRRKGSSPRDSCFELVLLMTTLWQRCSEKIRQEVSPQTFARWFAGIEELGSSESSLAIQAPDPFTANTLRSRYWGIITEILKQEGGPNVVLTLSASDLSDNGAIPSFSSAEMVSSEGLTSLQEKAQPHPERPAFLNPKYRFENFVVGNSNKFAHACSLRLADGVGVTHDPLFIYGGVGLGKTHLMHAIGHRILDQHPRARVFYTSSESFTNEVIASIRQDQMAAIRNKYRKVDILMIDDIQFLAGKDRTREEFFFTFEALQRDKKQIVITCDKMPKDTPGLEDRLRSRFSSGMVADIGAPDFETKVAILQKKAAEQGHFLNGEVAHYVAEKVRSNVRELEGCLIRLSIHASLHNIEIDLPVAQEVLRSIIRDPTRNSSVDNIQKIVAEHFRIRVSDLKSKNRSRSYAVPRQIAMYLSRKLTRASTTDIGRRFGGKDHSTVLHSTKKIEGLLKTDQTLSDTVQTLEQKIDLS